jgi:hypothetical protein
MNDINIHNISKATDSCLRLSVKQLKMSIDLFKSNVSLSIYTAFLFNGCDNYTMGLKNGLILSLYDLTDDMILFNIKADDKVIVRGSILDIFDDPEFIYTGNLSYDENSTFEELNLLIKKWAMLGNLITVDNCLY